MRFGKKLNFSPPLKGNIYRMKRNYAVEIIAALFILLFAYTASSKLIEHEKFWILLHNDTPQTEKYATLLSWAVPLSEIAITLLLFFPKSRRLGLWGSLAIMLLFTGYLGYMLFFTTSRPCGCGGVIQKMTWNQHLIFNIFFTLLAAFGLWWDNRIYKSSTRQRLSFTANA
jgi:putative oxidoreductase